MEDLQSLLEKINREGVEKAEAEGRKIIEAAKAKADQIVKSAQEEAAKAKADAEKNSAAYVERANETLRQASRDLVLNIKNAITTILEDLLVKNVDKALAEEKTATELVSAAIKDLAVSGEISCGAKLAETLKAQLAAQNGFSVVMDETTGNGFTVKLDGGRVEHSYTDETIAAELAKRLRSDLATLIK